MNVRTERVMAALAVCQGGDATRSRNNEEYLQPPEGSPQLKTRTAGCPRRYRALLHEGANEPCNHKQRCALAGKSVRGLASVVDRHVIVRRGAGGVR
jgi:hypothetical protein